MATVFAAIAAIASAIQTRIAATAFQDYAKVVRLQKRLDACAAFIDSEQKFEIKLRIYNNYDNSANFVALDKAEREANDALWEVDSEREKLTLYSSAFREPKLKKTFKEYWSADFITDKNGKIVDQGHIQFSPEYVQFLDAVKKACVTQMED